MSKCPKCGRSWKTGAILVWTFPEPIERSEWSLVHHMIDAAQSFAEDDGEYWIELSKDRKKVVITAANKTAHDRAFATMVRVGLWEEMPKKVLLEELFDQDNVVKHSKPKNLEDLR